MFPSSFPVLSTERLVLRSPEAGDDLAIFRHRNDAVVNTYLEDFRHATLADSQAFISRVLGEFAAGKSVLWVLSQKQEPGFIGVVCLWNIVPEQYTAEIGYTLDPAFHKMGYMQEAITAALTYGFDNLQLNTVDAYTHKDNKGSVRLLQRNGFLQQPDPKKEVSSNRVYFLLTKEKYAIGLEG